MGKGDKRSRRGKIYRHTYGKYRHHKKGKQKAKLEKKSVQQ
jgi:ribosomal small subunit protein bTHX